MDGIARSRQLLLGLMFEITGVTVLKRYPRVSDAAYNLTSHPNKFLFKQLKKNLIYHEMSMAAFRHTEA